MTIDEERVSSYIESLDQGIASYLDELALSARSQNVPIIRNAMISFMRTMLALHKPMTILEVGCAIGFSSLLMREYGPKDCQIVTIENYEPRIIEAKGNFEKYDNTKQITLIEGDAVCVLSQIGIEQEYQNLPDKYDLIFLDAAKGQYINIYNDVKRLLKQGGLLIADNVLQEGDILESRYAVTRRDRTIHTRMREFLYQLTTDADYTTSILQDADGIAISVKNNE